MNKDTICTIVQAGDYVHVHCAKCDDVCKVDFKGMALMVPQLQFKCPTCGNLGTFKLDTQETGWNKYTRGEHD